MRNDQYVHGYSTEEAKRLNDQAGTLDGLPHNDTIFSDNSFVLEAGCGVGAQTRIIARKNPFCNFLSTDCSRASLKEAEQLIKNENLKNVEFQQSDIYSLPYQEETFDAIFFVLCLSIFQRRKRSLSN